MSKTKLVKPVGSAQQPGVVIYRPVDETGSSHRRLAEAGCRICTLAADEDLAAALREHAPVHAVLAASLRGQRLSRAVLESEPELRLVAKYTIGVDDVDVEAATELGILVTHSPTEANWGGVAEGTIAMILSLLKRLQERNRRVREGAWRSEDLRGIYLGSRADGYPGRTIGIIGLGRIGRRVAELLAPWKLRLLATDPYVDAEVFESYGVERVGLDELLATADVVTVHCDLNQETTRLISTSQLGQMRQGAILINTARGRIVDVDAVCEALDQGQLAGAAFDVFPEEPLPVDARVLATDDRVILTPHMIAANQGGTLTAAVPWATEAVFAALAGKVPAHVYNESAIGAWRERFANQPLLSV